MTSSPTAIMLAKAIEASGLSTAEIAERAGIGKSSVIKMISQGITRVPLDSIPQLARTLSMDEREFLAVAIQEYHPGISEVLGENLGRRMADAETDALNTFRKANIRGRIEVKGHFRKALEGFLVLSATADP
ncbi:helix-turn-helix transcriptional regulator [Ruegeria sediminis]|uniref:Helix-turn-helix transcriptional regulator n=1 Tax=Ruegeria sediminis TaxID=2583820 RepID=A0ABY2WY48_9RHOB|nr:helix-turn-helix transcriptional regulator [Ruegeria sediminis]TMV07536.1 helix-turn-helix transcriptional regulator [Ruegeria sediminis]